MLGQFVLDHHDPVREPDLHKWARWFATADRTVARTDNGVIHVSTVFLGVDHAFGGGRPLLFETMSFLNEGFDEEAKKFKIDFAISLDMDRWHDWDEAERGHEETCRRMFHRLDQFKQGPVAELVTRMRVDVAQG